jgi:hypothetical protein
VLVELLHQRLEQVAPMMMPTTLFSSVISGSSETVWKRLHAVIATNEFVA